MRHFTVPLAGSSLPKVDRIKGENALEKKEAIRLTLAEIRRYKKIASMKLASGEIASAIDTPHGLNPWGVSNGLLTILNRRYASTGETARYREVGKQCDHP